VDSGKDICHGFKANVTTEGNSTGEGLDQPVSYFVGSRSVASYLDHNHPKCEHVGCLAGAAKAFQDFRCSKPGCGTHLAASGSERI
jgi:hypothetical protein